MGEPMDCSNEKGAGRLRGLSGLIDIWPESAAPFVLWASCGLPAPGVPPAPLPPLGLYSRAGICSVVFSERSLEDIYSLVYCIVFIVFTIKAQIDT